jgi:hypothetical protein
MPSWRDLKRFCEHDGWELYKDSDHFYYRKFDIDGGMRQTKVSKGSGEIEKGLWCRILRKQLQIDKKYFNSKL